MLQHRSADACMGFPPPFCRLACYFTVKVEVACKLKRYRLERVCGKNATRRSFFGNVINEDVAGCICAKAPDAISGFWGILPNRDFCFVGTFNMVSRSGFGDPTERTKGASEWVRI